MKTSTKLISVLGLIFLLSCGKSQELIDSESTVQKFFKAINEENDELMKKYYPEISTFDSYYKSDSINIKSTKTLNDSLIIVSATNYFTNGFGKQSKNELELYIVPDSTHIFSKISDSKGLTDHKENKLYSFALKTGCIEKSDSTDVQKNKKYTGAYLLAYKYTLDKLIDFKIDVNVVDWRWEKGYGNSASGKAIVKNNTTFSIPNVKYKITYYDRNENKITTDDGYVSYYAIKPGDSESFTFYTSYVGNASRANISLEFDEDLINEYILESDYNGNEYQEYMAGKDSSNDVTIK